ncbi:MAG: methyltransferase [Nitrosopumilus sp.]|nr:methyltransferase [Nitrosopumilus sp.]
MSKADKFNQWMAETIAPYVSGDILEIGSGLGNISQYFIDKNYQITLSDIDPYYLETLNKHFHDIGNVKEILSIDLQSKKFFETYKDLAKKFDTVFYLNVLEHLEFEDLAIQNSQFLLKPGGNLIILVPAYSFLYSPMDKALDHYRRYTQKRLNHVFQRNEMIVIKSFYFNFLGIVEWLYGKIKKLKTVPDSEMSTFNALIPFAKLFDKAIFHSMGLSVISVAKKR